LVGQGVGDCYKFIVFSQLQVVESLFCFTILLDI